ncbi:MAG: hypothetical protein AAGA03_02965 [Planctomycetota bacterium]
MLSKKQFTEQIFDTDLRRDYRDDNRWVETMIGNWSDETVMTNFIGCAYKVYSATATNALQLTILGGTEIRFDDSMIRNFGVTAANGTQDAETSKYVRQEIRRRRMRSHNQNEKRPFLSNAPHRRITPVKGVGSILSEKGWTPILNDALIIGAINARQEFAIALTPKEQKHWKRLNDSKITKVAATSAAFGASAALIKAWKEFFNTKAYVFFRGQYPRVFARELLGLYFFGYEPVFSWHQLGFRRKDPTLRPDFRTYIDKLRDVGFQGPTNKTRVMKTLSEFLFNDEDALTDPA